MSTSAYVFPVSRGTRSGQKALGGRTKSSIVPGTYSTAPRRVKATAVTATVVTHPFPTAETRVMPAKERVEVKRPADPAPTQPSPQLAAAFEATRQRLHDEAARSRRGAFLDGLGRVFGVFGPRRPELTTTDMMLEAMVRAEDAAKAARKNGSQQGPNR